jgi:hypothetical protein
MAELASGEARWKQLWAVGHLAALAAAGSGEPSGPRARPELLYPPAVFREASQRVRTAGLTGEGAFGSPRIPPSYQKIYRYGQDVEQKLENVVNHDGLTECL